MSRLRGNAIPMALAALMALLVLAPNQVAPFLSDVTGMPLCPTPDGDINFFDQITMPESCPSGP